MRYIKLLLCVCLCAFHLSGKSCTIVAVSGRATEDGRPLLLKNRDSTTKDIKIKIGMGQKYTYLCQCAVPDGNALSGYNEVGFSIVSAYSYNLPDGNDAWNGLIMQLALERCATLDDFEQFLDSIPKPMTVSANYGVMDAQGNVAIYETGAYTYTKYDAEDTDYGYIIRTNFSFSADTTGVGSLTPNSLPRYQIASNYLEEAILTTGHITKEHLFGLSRCLVDSEGVDLKDFAPFDENTTTPVEFKNYIPRYYSTSAMIIQGILPNEFPRLTTAWTMLGPPMFSVTIPYWITEYEALPQKAKMNSDGYSWFSKKGQQLKSRCFINNHKLDLAKLYNLCGTGFMQKIETIEEEFLNAGNNLMEELRLGEASDNDIEIYYSWVDSHIEVLYDQYNLNDNNAIMEDTIDYSEQEMEYYDLLGRRIWEVRDGVIIKKSGKTGIILN